MRSFDADRSRESSKAVFGSSSSSVGSRASIGAGIVPAFRVVCSMVVTVLVELFVAANISSSDRGSGCGSISEILCDVRVPFAKASAKAAGSVSTGGLDSNTAPFFESNDGTPVGLVLAAQHHMVHSRNLNLVDL